MSQRGDGYCVRHIGRLEAQPNIGPQRNAGEPSYASLIGTSAAPKEQASPPISQVTSTALLRPLWRANRPSIPPTVKTDNCR